MVETPLTAAVVVMAHPARREQAEKLAADVDAPIVWDRDHGEWDTAARAWQTAIEHHPDWAVVLQDDAQPIDAFITHLHRALAAAMTTCTGLYVGIGRPRAAAVTRATEAADTAGHAWLEANSLLWGVGVAIPGNHVPQMLTWCHTSPLPYDQRIGAYYRTQRHQPVRYTWPSLVNHADGPTLIPRHRHEVPRRAHRTGPASTYQTGATTIM